MAAMTRTLKTTAKMQIVKIQNQMRSVRAPHEVALLKALAACETRKPTMTRRTTEVVPTTAAKQAADEVGFAERVAALADVVWVVSRAVVVVAAVAAEAWGASAEVDSIPRVRMTFAVAAAVTRELIV
jgi:hypothetical protein